MSCDSDVTSSPPPHYVERWRWIHDKPSLGYEVIAVGFTPVEICQRHVFVVVGMMACFGSVPHTPLAVTIMVAEMTGSFSMVPGAMVAVAIPS